MSIASEITRIQGAKSDIADAIEAKGVTVPSSTKIDGMAALIGQIDEVREDQAVENDVIFIDYDGVILHSYTAAEFALLTELPANPTRKGLTAQGWNWTLSDAKTYVATHGGLVIGQNYVPTDGKTHIWIHLDETYHSPYIGVGVNGTVTIEWGEGFSNSTLTGTDAESVKRAKAPYTHGGNYEVKISLTSGTGYRINGLSSASLLCSLTGSSNYANRLYASAIRKIQIGQNCTLGGYAFSYCCNIETITLPLNCIYTKSHIFFGTYSLKCIVLPPMNVGTSTYFISSCTCLKYVSIPYSFGAIGNYFLYNCYSLLRVHLAPTTTSYGTTTLYATVSLRDIVIPAEVTAFGSNAFYICYSLRKIRFLGSTPPTIGATNAFSSLHPDCVISVPTGKLSAYQSAANYPDPNTYTYIEE